MGCRRASTFNGYFGGELTGYVMPDLAVKGSIDYLSVSGGHITTYGIGAEYLTSETLPISIYGGYSRGDLSNNAGHTDMWFAGLKFYTDGPMSLVTHHRTGTTGTIGSVTGISSLF